MDSYLVELHTPLVAPGDSVFHIVTEKNIQIDLVKSSNKNHRTTLLKANLTMKQSDSILNVLENLHLDTLDRIKKSKYIQFNSNSLLILRGNRFSDKNIMIYGQGPASIDSLWHLVYGMLPKEKIESITTYLK